MPDTVPRSWRQLRTWQELERWKEKGGLIVILDTATTPHYHLPSCEHVVEAHFETKRSNKWRNGAYYWIPTRQDASGYAVACESCKGQ
jgi:hypothetical protein